MLVRDAMTAGAETVAPSDTLEAAARRMRDRGIGALVVCEGDRLAGIVTDRDLVVRGIAAGLHPAHSTVGTVMTPNVLECRDDEDLEAAAVRMQRGAVRRIVVVDADGMPEGLLSLDDVALRSAALAGEILEHVRAPERPIAAGRGPWPWWEDAPGMPP